MESGDAIKHLTAARVAIALSAAALRVGQPAMSPYLRVLHTHVLATFRGRYPTLNQLLQSYASIPFRFDVAKGPSDSGSNTVGYHLKNCATVADVLRIILRASIKHTHALTSVFDIISPLKPFDAVRHNSPVHLFLRKIGVAFHSLSFDMLAHLRSRLASYVKHADGIIIGKDAPNSLQTNTSSILPHPFPVAILKESIEELSNHNSCSNYATLANFHFAALKNNFQYSTFSSSFHQLSTFSHVEYALHLEYMRRRDVSIASELLHRGFDLSLAIPPLPSPTASKTKHHSSSSPRDLQRVRTDALYLPRRSRVEAIPPEEVGYSAADSAPAAKSAKERPQYAALALAALHANVGEFESASRALDDCVRLSQHKNDVVCQARALKWLVRTTRSLTRRRELLKRMDDNIALAEEELHSPKPQPKNDDNNSNDKYRNITSIMSRVGISRGDIRPNSLLLSAKAWYSYASLPTAIALARISLRISTSHHAFSSDAASKTGIIDIDAPLTLDQTRAVCALAELTAEAETPTKGLELLDSHLRPQGGYPVIDEEFGDTKSTIFPQRDLLRKSRAQIAFTRALRRRHLHAARYIYLETLAAYANCPAAAQGVPAVYTEAKLDYLEAEARLAIAEEDYFEAYKKADALRKAAAGAELPARAIVGSIIAAQAYIKSGAEGWNSVPLATGAVSLSESRGLIGLNVLAKVTLAEALFTVEKNNPHQALNILAESLPTGVGGLGKFTQAHTRRVYAQLLLAIWEDKTRNMDTDNDNDSDNTLKTVLAQLEAARLAYTDAEDLEGVRDCAYLLAKVYNATGNIEMRNLAAQMYSVAFDTQLKREQSCDEELP